MVQDEDRPAQARAFGLDHLGGQRRPGRSARARCGSVRRPADISRSSTTSFSSPAAPDHRAELGGEPFGRSAATVGSATGRRPRLVLLPAQQHLRAGVQTGSAACAAHGWRRPRTAAAAPARRPAARSSAGPARRPRSWPDHAEQPDQQQRADQVVQVSLLIPGVEHGLPHHRAAPHGQHIEVGRADGDVRLRRRRTGLRARHRRRRAGTRAAPAARGAHSRHRPRTATGTESRCPGCRGPAPYSAHAEPACAARQAPRGTRRNRAAPARPGIPRRSGRRAPRRPAQHAPIGPRGRSGPSAASQHAYPVAEAVDGPHDLPAELTAQVVHIGVDDGLRRRVREHRGRATGSGNGWRAAARPGCSTGRTRAARARRGCRPAARRRAPAGPGSPRRARSRSDSSANRRSSARTRASSSSTSKGLAR